jgi:hypothetical protein|nr:MAG TPA: NinG recombination protein [Caudoviricetes sp.]
MKAVDIPNSVRRIIYERDKHCRICGAYQNLHIHHIIYRSQWRNGHQPFNLILLCERCHRKVHADKNKWQLELLRRAMVKDVYQSRAPFKRPPHLVCPDNVSRLLDYYEKIDSSCQSWEIKI